jgi:hypothetical protein
MEKYQLIKKSQNKFNKFIVTIEADSNDADYITEISEYSKDVFEEYVVDGIIHLLKNASGSHKLGNYNNEYDLDIPFNGWDGYCHTLSYVKVEYVDENGVIWDVNININS